MDGRVCREKGIVMKKTEKMTLKAFLKAENSLKGTFIVAAPTAILEKDGDVIRIAGTYHAFKECPVECNSKVEIPTKRSMEFHENYYYKKAENTAKVTDLMAAYNLPKNVVYALAKRIDFCKIVFIMCECIKQGKYIPSKTLLFEKDIEKLRIGLDNERKKCRNSLQHHNPYDVRIRESWDFQDYIYDDCSRKNIKTIISYLVATYNSKKKPYITSEMAEKHFAEIVAECK